MESWELVSLSTRVAPLKFVFFLFPCYMRFSMVLLTYLLTIYPTLTDDFVELKSLYQGIYLIIFLLLFYYSYPKFTPLLSPALPTHAPTINHHPVVHVNGSFVPVCWLEISPHFPLDLHPSTSLDTVSLFFVTMPLFYFACLLCSLGPSYMWVYMVFVFYNLAYFT